MKNKKLMDVIHETAKDLYQAGTMSGRTMREFDVLCLPRVKCYTPIQIKRIRIRNQVSQSVFAAYLNTTPSTVQKWEQGQMKPNGIAFKLLNLVERRGLLFLAA